MSSLLDGLIPVVEVEGNISHWHFRKLGIKLSLEIYKMHGCAFYGTNL